MATITSTPTGGSLTVSGTTQQTGTISWTKPTVPSDVIISSCVLTGTATASMSKGSATITVNGTTVTSGTSFTINLGTANNTTSVTTTAKGGNKNANGTVSFSNLVYTVTYELVAKPTYTVTFKDWDGTTLKTQTVEEGSSATAPSNPTRTGYKFTGWDASFNNVTSDLTVTAQYAEVQYYTVTFKDWDGTTLKTQTVEEGSSATAPSNPSRDGYAFTGWDKDFSNITNDLIVTAEYSKVVTMIEWSGLGTVATGLKAHAGDEGYIHDSYKINLDWDNESFDIIITEEFNRNNSNYNVHYSHIGDISINDKSFTIGWSDGHVSIGTYSDNNIEEYYDENYGAYPITISFTKDGIYVKSCAPFTGEESNPVLLSGSENVYETNHPIYLIDDKLKTSSVSNRENPDYNTTFDLIVSERINEEPDIELKPVEKSTTLRAESVTEDNTYNNKWTDIQNVNDNDTSTYGTLVITGSSQSGYVKNSVTTIFDIDNNIPANATINNATLTVRAKSSATTNLYMSVDVNNDSNKRVINEQLMSSTSSTNYTAEVTDYVKELDTIALTYRTAGTSNRTATVYDIRVDVDYTTYEEVKTYSVTFVDWDGTVIETQQVGEGKSALAPTNPSREGYIFIGWDGDFTLVVSDLVITAQYELYEEPAESIESSLYFGGDNMINLCLGQYKIERLYMGDILIYKQKSINVENIDNVLYVDGININYNEAEKTLNIDEGKTSYDESTYTLRFGGDN